MQSQCLGAANTHTHTVLYFHAPLSWRRNSLPPAWYTLHSPTPIWPAAAAAPSVFQKRTWVEPGYKKSCYFRLTFTAQATSQNQQLTRTQHTTSRPTSKKQKRGTAFTETGFYSGWDSPNKAYSRCQGQAFQPWASWENLNTEFKI